MPSSASTVHLGHRRSHTTESCHEIPHHCTNPRDRISAPRRGRQWRAEPRPEARQNQVKPYPLESAAGVNLRNLTATPATLQGKKGLQVTSSGVEEVATIEGLDFDNGIIEAEIAGAPGPGAGEGARGFVGIAFRVQNELRTFDAFYLRPTNGRADDQERRNHAVQ